MIFILHDGRAKVGDEHWTEAERESAAAHGYRSVSKVYLAGPMTGIPDFNYPAFDAAANHLRECGISVSNPADWDREEEGYDPDAPAKPLDHYMIRDLAEVCAADAVVVLPGWEKSRGANLEVYVAWYLGKPVLSYPTLRPVVMESLGHSVAYSESTATHTFQVSDFLIQDSQPGEWSDPFQFKFTMGPGNGVELVLRYWDPEAKQPHMDLVDTVVVGISGKKGSGKDTAGARLTDEWGFERVGFADLLKRSFAALFGVDVGLLEEYKNNPYYGATLGPFDATGSELDEALTVTLTLRQALQRYGTEAHRDAFWDSIWIDAALRNIQPGGRYVFTDVRFPNEADALVALRQRGANVVLVTVTRPGTDSTDTHSSEQDMTPYADAIIENDKDIAVLHKAVDALCAHLHIERSVAA